MVAILDNYWADYAETLHACRYPPGNARPCVTVGVLLHVRTCKKTVVLDLENAESIALKLGILMRTG